MARQERSSEVEDRRSQRAAQGVGAVRLRQPRAGKEGPAPDGGEANRRPSRHGRDQGHAERLSEPTQSARSGVIPDGPTVSAAADGTLSETPLSNRYRVIETITPGPEDTLCLARCVETGALAELRILSGRL